MRSTKARGTTSGTRSRRRARPAAIRDRLEHREPIPRRIVGTGHIELQRTVMCAALPADLHEPAAVRAPCWTATSFWKDAAGWRDRRCTTISTCRSGGFGLKLRRRPRGAQRPASSRRQAHLGTVEGLLPGAPGHRSAAESTVNVSRPGYSDDFRRSERTEVTSSGLIDRGVDGRCDLLLRDGTCSSAQNRRAFGVVKEAAYEDRNTVHFLNKWDDLTCGAVLAAARHSMRPSGVAPVTTG